MGDSAQARPQRVFISYRRTDTAYPAGWLYDSLAERFGDAQIFKDVDSIGPGDDFVDALTRAVSMCDVLLALIGTTWLSTEETGRGRRIDQPDDFVRVEIETALRRNVRVIPILVEGATMPTPDEVPSSLAALTRRQAVELSWNRFNADVEGLIRAIESTPTTPPGPSRRGPREPRRPEDAQSRWSQSEPAPADQAQVRPTLIAALACGAVGAVLMLLGAGEPLLAGSGDNLYSGTTQQDIQHAFPSVVLVAAVLLIARPAVAAPWLVGAGITVLALDYTSTTLWVGLRVGYEDAEVGVESLTLRTAGAMLVLIAVFVAARAMGHAPPPVDWPSAAGLAAASLLTIVGAAGVRYHLPVDMPSSVAPVAAAAPTAVFLIALGYVASWSRSAGSAGPAVTVAGVTAAVVYVLELVTLADQDIPGRGSVTLMVIGLAIMSGVGLWLWSGASWSPRLNRAVAPRGRTARTGSRRG